MADRIRRMNDHGGPRDEPIIETRETITFEEMLGQSPANDFSEVKAAIDRENQPTSADELEADQRRYAYEQACIEAEREQSVREMASFIHNLRKLIIETDANQLALANYLGNRFSINVMSRASLIHGSGADFDTIMLAIRAGRPVLDATSH